MRKRENTWVHISRVPLFQVRVRQATVISSIRLQCSRRGNEVTTSTDARIILWAKYSPKVKVADGVLCDQPPYVVASFTLDEEGVASCPNLVWALEEGSVVTICATTELGVPEVLKGERLVHQLSTSAGGDVDAVLRDVSAHTTEVVPFGEGQELTITLLGKERLRNYYVPPWRPLLVYRWFELKDCVREATVHPSNDRAPLRMNRAKECSKRRLLHGEVLEAACVSSCGSYVLWKDGTMSPSGEVVPYRRVFAPARADKRVRVRAFPHRFANIVGEVPFGCTVEAIGRKVDCYTNEVYVLLLLQVAPNAALLAETYELTYVSAGKWLWGWSKVVTRGGTVLLAEVCDPNNTHIEGQMWVEHLKEPLFYTSARDGRRVRIRSGPSLRESIVGHLEGNEVKLAVSVWHPSGTATARVPPATEAAETDAKHVADVASGQLPSNTLHHFLQWECGGFSLLRNNDRVYLVPVELKKEPRHFPVCPRPTPQSPDVVPITRKRPRFDSPSSEESQKDSSSNLKPDLWSPSMLPEAVAAGLKSGCVRLDDLPTIDTDDDSVGSSSISHDDRKRS